MRKGVFRFTLVYLSLISTFFCFGCFPAPVKAAGEWNRPRTLGPPKHYWGDIDGFLNRQWQAVLDVSGEALNRFPPQLPEPIERRMALLMLDTVFHDVNAPRLAPVQEFLRYRMERALTEIEGTKVKEGAVIWKLYNHGFVVRTPTVTVGFDLVSGYSMGRRQGFFEVGGDFVDRLVRQCDILFVSHRHGDHADEYIIPAFINQSKPVVAPPRLWADKPIHSKITHLNRNTDGFQTVEVGGGKHKLKVIVYPGHQGRTSNNVSLVFTPEGMSFCHTGDQHNREDFAWIDKVGGNHRVDVLLTNCWTADIKRAVKGFDPELVITGHENELNHSVDHREPYWFSYDLLYDLNYPYVLMTWGELFRYKPKAK